MGRMYHIENWVFCAVSAFFFTVYAELFYEAEAFESTGYYQGFLAGNGLTILLVLRCLLLFVTVFLVLYVVFQHGRRAMGFVFRHRWLIGGLLVGFCLLFTISGSSIGALQSVLPGESKGVLFGIPRVVRSDEWMTTTLLTASQDINGYAPISNILRGIATNVTIGYGLPSWSLISLFRPQQWGFLLFGFARGVSWSWVVPYVGAFLVTLECGLLYTRGNRILSTVAAVMITFSPFTMWWNPCMFFICGQGLVIALDRFLRAESFLKKTLYAALIAWLCGCYICIMYPAWMVPFFYVFAFMGLCVVIRYWRDYKARFVKPMGKRFRNGLIVLFIFLVCIAVALAWCFLYASNEIAAVGKTVYPGQRFETGGGCFWCLFDYGASVFNPIVPSSAPTNACEFSGLFTLFPLGTILASWQVFYKKQHDPLLISMLILDAFFIIFMAVGIPCVVARVTLMSNVPAFRLIGAIGYIEMILLIRALALHCDHDETDSEVKPGLLTTMAGGTRIILITFTSIIGGTALVLLYRVAAGGYLRGLYISILLPIIVCIFYTLFTILVTRNARHEKALLLLCTVLLVTSGVCVNPIQIGTSIVTDSQLAAAVKGVLADEETDASQATESESSGNDLWVATESLATQNICVAAGAPTINCTNTVPDIQRWKLLDPTLSSEDIYNRYAHIVVSLTSEETSFELIQGDTFHLVLNYADMKKLGIGYIVSPLQLTNQPQDGVFFEDEGEGDGYQIYKVNYAS